MKSLFDKISAQCSKNVTHQYSTSFSTAVQILDESIRQDIYNIYGFVRLADEIVDSFHDYDKNELFKKLELDLEVALKNRISLNPILNAFQETIHRYNISQELINAFMNSMRMDLTKTKYNTQEEYKKYIYGSADVVGLMCLCIFVQGDQQLYDALKKPAMRLGSAFQKVNFLRDLKADYEYLNRSYFPGINLEQLNDSEKNTIINEIEADFEEGLKGIKQLPNTAKFGVYVAFMYYKTLLNKLKKTPSLAIKNTRIRVPDYQKYGLFAQCYVNFQLNRI
jgi:15-cis-phytoene synthase